MDGGRFDSDNLCGQVADGQRGFTVGEEAAPVKQKFMKLEPEEIDALAAAVAGKLRASSENGKIGPRLLSIDRGGEYLSRSAHSIRHLIKAGKLPVVKIDGRIFLDIRDLDRIIEKSKQVAL
jgi:hypothetical protein